MSWSRRQDENRNCLYEMFRMQAGPFVCFYCGAAAQTLDHCPPISRVDDYRSLNLTREQYLKVPACKECNTLASNSLQESLIEREMHVKSRLEQRYKRLLDMPHWQDSDIRKLGRNLRSKIKQDMQRKRAIEARIDYGGGVNQYIEELETINPFAELDNEET